LASNREKWLSRYETNGYGISAGSSRRKKKIGLPKNDSP